MTLPNIKVSDGNWHSIHIKRFDILDRRERERERERETDDRQRKREKRGRERERDRDSKKIDGERDREERW